MKSNYRTKKPFKAIALITLSAYTLQEHPAPLKRKGSEAFTLEGNPLAKEKHDQNAGGSL